MKLALFAVLTHAIRIGIVNDLHTNPFYQDKGGSKIIVTLPNRALRRLPLRSAFITYWVMFGSFDRLGRKIRRSPYSRRHGLSWSCSRWCKARKFWLAQINTCRNLKNPSSKVPEGTLASHNWKQRCQKSLSASNRRRKNQLLFFSMGTMV